MFERLLVLSAIVGVEFRVELALTKPQTAFAPALWLQTLSNLAAFWRGLTVVVDVLRRFMSRREYTAPFGERRQKWIRTRFYRGFGLVAQSVEQRPFKPLVAGSSPAQPTTFNP